MKNSRKLTRRQALKAGSIAAGAAIGASLLPAKWIGAFAQDPVIDTLRSKGGPSREKIALKVQPFPMTDVKLRPGPFYNMMQVNQRYLHTLETDRLLHTFRITAGLPTSAQPYGGWEAPDVELRGHYVGGHYLSAAAFTYVTAGDDDIKKKADTLVSELAKCQQANGGGYISAFPTEFMERLRNGGKVWAPFYTIHKIMAGNLDMYLYCGNEQALDVCEKMAGWTANYLKPVSDDQWAMMQHTEHGGMVETLFNLYAITGKEEYLALAQRFEHKAFFGPLAARRDELNGLHVNTNIPKVIGAARGYELTGDERYHTIADYFWHEVTSQRAYATGGTSNGESWQTDPGQMQNQLGTSAEECCCSYNMMKLTRHLFGWTADPKAMDYYERVLFNARLGTQDKDGMYMYYLPLAPRAWKTFGTATESFWCCTGTGSEEYSKTNDSIYFHDANGIYVNLFIASELNWKEKGVKLIQDTNFPEQDSTTLTLQTQKPTQLALHVRVPYWATRGVTVKINGQAQKVDSTPSSYLALNREWKNGDKVEISMPMSLHPAPISGDATLQAAMYGPLVLAGRYGGEGLTHEMIYGQLGPHMKPAPGPSPEVFSKSGDVSAAIEAAPAGKLSFRLAGQLEATPLVPLYQISGERYAVYWKVNSSKA
jgi:uncharacterized protein